MKLKKEYYFTDDCLVKDQLYLTIKDLITCSLCNKILKDPFVCSICQNSFCKKCLESYSSLKKCPNEEIESEFKPYILKENMLSKLKYKCNNCNKEVQKNEIKAHLEENCETNEDKREKTLSELMKSKKQLIKLSSKEMQNKKIDYHLTSKYIFLINLFYKI